MIKQKFGKVSQSMCSIPQMDTRKNIRLIYEFELLFVPN